MSSRYSTLEEFIAWQAENPDRRYVTIKIEKRAYLDPETLEPASVHIWVYDSSVGESQTVKRVEDIDLEGEKERREREQLAKLQAKYETNN